MRHPLHQAAVAQKNVRMMIDDRMTRPIEGRRERALGERHAYGIGDALAQRARGGFDAEV